MVDLLALGPEVEVLHPPQLRAQLARAAGQIADLYRAARPDPGTSRAGSAGPPPVRLPGQSRVNLGDELAQFSLGLRMLLEQQGQLQFP